MVEDHTRVFDFETAGTSGLLDVVSSGTPEVLLVGVIQNQMVVVVLKGEVKRSLGVVVVAEVLGQRRPVSMSLVILELELSVLCMTLECKLDALHFDAMDILTSADF